MLTIYEELFALSIHEDKGVVISSAARSLHPALAAGILTELAILEKLVVTENHRLRLVDATPTGDEILDESLEMIQASEKERKLAYWIEGLLPKAEKFHRRLAERLIQAGIIQQEEDHLTWVVPAPEHPDIEASAKYWIKRRLRTIVLACEEARLRDIALLTLLKAGGMGFLVFLRDERKVAYRRSHELMVGQALVNPAAQAIEEIAAALESVVEED
jgi:hypothetical protein